MKPSSLRRVQRTLPAAIALLALVILNGAAWWSYRFSSDQIRTNFSRNLLSTARILSHGIVEAYWSEIERRSLDLEDRPLSAGDPAQGEASAFLSMEGWLDVYGSERVKSLSPQQGGAETFQDIYLLDGQGGLVASLSGILDPNSSGPSDADTWNLHPAFSEEERTAILGALEQGRDRISDEVFREGIYYRTAFAPIALEGKPVGLIGLRANLLFGDRLTTIRNGILAASTVGAILVALLTVMFYRVWEGLRRAEDRLIHQERLAQLGAMVAGVAHEIRNPLGIIEQTGELIRRRYGQGQNDDLLEYIPQEVERLNRIVSRFLEFARPQADTDAVAECWLQDEIETVHRQLLPQAQASGIEFEREVEDALPSIRGLRPDAARQILLNLILNAFDVSERGSRVVVALKKSNGAPRLVISDQGPGMSPEILAKARDPFFTTKEKGSGLGLALVAKLLEEVGASMEIQSEYGQGTHIVIHFKS
jgi:signal transduction histidine kinase